MRASELAADRIAYAAKAARDNALAARLPTARLAN